jgi:hypothetical protein
MNVPFGGSLTKVARLPNGAQPSFAVSYPEPPTALPKLLFTVIIVCFFYSLLHHFGVIEKLTGGAFGKRETPARVGTNATPSVETKAPATPATPPAAPAPAK